MSKTYSILADKIAESNIKDTDIIIDIGAPNHLILHVIAGPDVWETSMELSNLYQWILNNSLKVDYSLIKQDIIAYHLSDNITVWVCYWEEE